MSVYKVKTERVVCTEKITECDLCHTRQERSEWCDAIDGRDALNAMCLTWSIRDGFTGEWVDNGRLDFCPQCAKSIGKALVALGVAGGELPYV